MKDYESTEIAYKNGYIQGQKDAQGHAYWIEERTLYGKQRRCSHCGNCDNPKTAVFGHFCWFCGYKMDLEK